MQETFGDRSDISVETIKKKKKSCYLFMTKDLGTNISLFSYEK